MLLLIKLDLNLAVWSLQKLLPPSVLVGHTLPLSRCLIKQERKKRKKEKKNTQLCKLSTMSYAPSLSEDASMGHKK